MNIGFGMITVPNQPLPLWVLRIPIRRLERALQIVSEFAFRFMRVQEEMKTKPLPSITTQALVGRTLLLLHLLSEQFHLQIAPGR
jgi:hypothetical protein